MLPMLLYAVCCASDRYKHRAGRRSDEIGGQEKSITVGIMRRMRMTEQEEGSSMSTRKKMRWRSSEQGEGGERTKTKKEGDGRVTSTGKDDGDRGGREECAM